MKFLITFIIMILCNNNAKGQIYDHELFEYIFENEHLIDIDAKKYEIMLENVKSQLDKKNYYYYKYMIGFTVLENRNVEFLLKADKLGNMYAGKLIYDNYYKDNFLKRVKYLESSANLGNAISQFNIGLMYFYGRKGIVIDKNKGLNLFINSAKQGWGPAISTLSKPIIKELLTSDDYLFWTLIKNIYVRSDSSELDVNKIYTQVNNKKLFCDNIKEYVYKNEVIDDNYFGEKFPKSLELLTLCMMSQD